jgi:hypothetical protein
MNGAKDRGVEEMLGRKILTAPPNLHDWIKHFGGYAKITPEGWADYNRAIAVWRERGDSGRPGNENAPPKDEFDGSTF